MDKHFKNFIDKEAIEELKTWVFGLFNDGMLPQNPTCSEGVRFGNNIKSLNITPPKVYFDILDKVAARVEDVIGDPIESKSIGHSIMYHRNGAIVANHTDFVMSELPAYRCNIMISKPESGGEPTFQGNRLEVNEGDLWTFYAYTETHGANMTHGSVDRVLLSFGFDIKTTGAQ